VRAALLLCVVGCSPSPPTGSPCGPNGECPSELECSAVTDTCEKPGTVGPGVDADVDMSPIDAEIDAPAMLCAGTFQMVCVDAPTNAQAFSATTTIDTDASMLCATSSPAGLCVIAGTQITVEAGATVNATGTRPLVLLANTITIAGIVDVGSTAARTGAAANSSDCVAGEVPLNDDGGAGGSFGGLGGTGSSGITSPGATQVPTTIRGGCPGSDGAAATGTFGRGGAGGGAIAVLATDAISISGTIRAGGAGGTGGSATAAAGAGGSGGMILVDAMTIQSAGALRANGGGGGGGGDGGNPGEDAIGAAAAAGGTGTGTTTTGNGGAGSVNATLTGSGGVNGSGTDGGGGGGAGVTKLIAPQQLVSGTVSPPPT
jgi:hypothetical protein